VQVSHCYLVGILFISLAHFLLALASTIGYLLIKNKLFSGGGVGGLTLAFALSKSPDIHVDVYEAASKFAEIGAGIGVWWRTRQVLKSLGLEEDVVRLLSFRPGQDKSEPGLAVWDEESRQLMSLACSTLYTVSKG
jgi:hypothetical protein